MARNIPVSELIDRTLQVVDREAQTLVLPRTQVMDYLSTEFGHFYELLVDSGEVYAEKTAPPFTMNGQALYPLPSDFFQEIRFDWLKADGSLVPLVKISVQMIHRFSRTAMNAIAYRLAGGKVALYPTPPAGQTYQLMYVPAPCRFTDETKDTIDGLSGLEELLVLGAGVRCDHKLGRIDHANSLRSDLKLVVDRLKVRATERSQVPMAIPDVDPMDQEIGWGSPWPWGTP